MKCENERCVLFGLPLPNGRVCPGEMPGMTAYRANLLTEKYFGKLPVIPLKIRNRMLALAVKDQRK